MTWVALLRGVNVGGANTLPMAEFRESLLSLGHTNVQTYIQSGNAVFESGATDELAVSAGIRKHLRSVADLGRKRLERLV